MAALPDSNWLWGIGGSIAGTVVGGLVLRGLGLGAIDARLKGVEGGIAEIHDRLDRLETPLIQRGYNGPDRRRGARAE